MLVHYLEISFNQQLVCKFDWTENTSSNCFSSCYAHVFATILTSRNIIIPCFRHIWHKAMPWPSTHSTVTFRHMEPHSMDEYCQDRKSLVYDDCFNSAIHPIIYTNISQESTTMISYHSNDFLVSENCWTFHLVWWEISCQNIAPVVKVNNNLQTISKYAFDL